MAKNKKQHFVPRFYLRKFSADGRSVNIWNLTNEKRIQGANLKNQCYKDYFYGEIPCLGTIPDQKEIKCHFISGWQLVPCQY